MRGTSCPTVAKHSFSRKGASWYTHVSTTYMSIGAPQSEDHKWSRVDPILKGPVALNRWSVALREYDPRETDCLRGASEVLAGWPEPDRDADLRQHTPRWPAREIHGRPRRLCDG